MSSFSFLNILGKPVFKPVARRRRRHGSIGVEFRKLEQRFLLASVFYDSSISELMVIGDSGNNVGQVELVGDQVEATIDGLGPYQFPVADVAHVRFIGFAGNDTFANLTSIPSSLYGHDGIDSLTGGSGDDTINGGRGNDLIRGGDGDDHLIGSSGADNIQGENGHDRILGGAGENVLSGNDGNDIIFGGDDDDEIRGGAGNDQIYALGGNDTLYSGAGGIPGGTTLDELDLVLGLDGDDWIYGESGLDVLWGGNGNDTINGGTGENRLHGQAGTDTISGGNLADFLTGGSGIDIIYGYGGDDFVRAGQDDDAVFGGDGNDTLLGQEGNDSLYGENGRDFLEGGWGDDYVYGGGISNAGDGTDVSSYYADRAIYTRNGDSSSAYIADNFGSEGYDRLFDIGFARFTDGLVDMDSTGIEIITIQPIIVSNDNGRNTAEYFGTEAQQADIHEGVDAIFAQADIDVEWLAPNFWDHTFANVGNSSYRPASDLDAIVYQGEDAGVAHGDVLVLNLYFVEVVPGFDDTGENYVNGLAYIDFNGVAIHVGDNMLNRESRRDTVAKVAAHEIAHNLGLDHVSDPSNLMASGTALTQEQIDIIRASFYTVPA